MESLYVCLFSNGHIKVGRSIDASSRIAQHAERVACMGVELADSRTMPVADDADLRERRLISRCNENAAVRFKSEWFAGLDFETVCGWAGIIAVELSDQVESSLLFIRRRLGMTQAELAMALGCTQGNIGFIERGQTLMPDMAKRLIRYAATRGLTVTYEDLYGPAISPQASQSAITPICSPSQT